MRWWIALALLGCGPSVTIGGSTSGEDETSATESATDSTTTTPTPTTTTTTTTTTTSTSATNSTSTSDTDDSTTTGEDETDTTGMCSCEGTPIGIDDVTDDGYTPAELLAATAFSVPSFEWRAIAGDPVVAASGSNAYGGGLVVDEVGGCCGSFLCGPCPEGVTIENVQLTVTTADGRLDEVFTGTLTGDDLGGFGIEIAPVPIASLSGTLASDTFDIDGEPFTPTTINVSVEWDDELALERLWVFAEDGKNGELIGLYGPV